MSESTEKPGDRKRWRISPILTSAFFLSVATALFLLQGRAYREGWLGSFGLKSAQFPISTADTYWLAFHGWLNSAAGWFNNAWDLYIGYLPKLILPVALFAFGIYTWEWLKARIKQRASERSTEGDSPRTGNRVQRWLAANGWKAWLARVVVSLAVAPVSLALFPLMLFLGGLLIVVLIVIAVLPFENIGKQAAADFCKQPVTHAARIVLTEGAGGPEWGYQIECNSDVCAMIRNGRVYVVPTRNVQRVEAPSPRVPAIKSSEKAQDQLCPVPDDSPAVPA